MRLEHSMAVGTLEFFAFHGNEVLVAVRAGDGSRDVVDYGACATSASGDEEGEDREVGHASP